MRPANNFDKQAGEFPRQSASRKVIAIVFNKIVALWPADSSEWALAMQAELLEMESTQESLQWLAGGIMSLGKAWWNGALSSGDKKEHTPVKKPGILAALITVAALALLLIPSANQGLRAVLTSWQADEYFQDQAQLQQMAREAESRGDVKTMAFAAMRFASWKDSVSYANKAVALDPSLTWIFSQGFFGDAYVPESRDWPAKLAAWDPGNGVAYLIQGQIRAAELSHNRNTTMIGPKHDPQWLEAGRKALESPRFDSYRRQRLEFDREFIRAHGLKDPSVIATGAFGLRAGWISVWPTQVYSETLLAEAKAAVERGDQQTAARDAWAVAHFGELLRASGGNESERLSSVVWLRPAYAILQPLLAAEGRSDEAKMLSQELEAIKPGAPATILNGIWSNNGNEWWKTASVAMNFAVASAVLLSIALLFAGIWIFAARFVPNLSSGVIYRIACGIGRFAPAGLLVSLAVLAVSYLPATETINNYLERPISTATVRSLIEIYYSVYWYPEYLRHPLNAPTYHVVFWISVMVLGLLTITTIITRNIFNRTPRPKAA
jgi:hypothetical protein